MKTCSFKHFTGRLAAALCVVSVLTGCGKPARPSSDLSGSNQVYSAMGTKEGELANGLPHIFTEKDGLTVMTELDGIPCRHLERKGAALGYFYFYMNDTFKKSSVKNVNIEVEYFDKGTGRMFIQYDATKAAKGQFPAYTRSDIISLGDTGLWQTNVFKIRDATFNRGQNSGADFRIAVMPPELYVRRVTVTRAKN